MEERTLSKYINYVLLALLFGLCFYYANASHSLLYHEKQNLMVLHFIKNENNFIPYGVNISPFPF